MKPEKPPVLRIAEADAEGFFTSGLEYSPPVRGMWNIVHMGMLVPEAHQIYCCAQGCLRGVVLTAAEMNAMERLSWISLTEEDMFNGTLEQSLTEGVSEIIEKLPAHPKMVPLFLSCMHLFAGCDFDGVIADLSARYPDITFIDCYMTPTMRTTIPPVPQTCRQLYSGLQPRPADPESVNIIGCDRPTDPDSELVQIIRNAGLTLRDLTLCKTYDDYLQMAESRLNILWLPTAHAAADALEERLHIPQIYLPAHFDFEKLRCAGDRVSRFFRSDRRSRCGAPCGKGGDRRYGSRGGLYRRHDAVLAGKAALRIRLSGEIYHRGGGRGGCGGICMASGEPSGYPAVFAE